MAETAASGGPAPGYERHPDHYVEVRPGSRRVRVALAGETVADSARTLIVRERGYAPVHYFPREDVRMDLAERTDSRTYCPFKGEASYWTLRVGERSEDDAMWSYETPFDEALALKDRVAFHRDRMDRWREGGEEGLAPARGGMRAGPPVKAARRP